VNKDYRNKATVHRIAGSVLGIPCAIDKFQQMSETATETVDVKKSFW